MRDKTIKSDGASANGPKSKKYLRQEVDFFYLRQLGVAGFWENVLLIMSQRV